MDIKVIILGLSATAKYVARECHLAEIECIGVDKSKGPSFYSKYFSETHVLPESFFSGFLRKLLEHTTSTYLVCPTSDEWIDFIASSETLFRQERLKTSPGYFNGSYSDLGDKKRLQKLCLEIGVAYPKSIVHTCSIKEEAVPINNLNFPLFCKPTNRSGLADIMKGRKGWIVEKESQLHELIKNPKLSGIELIIQEIISGPESNIKVLGTVAGTLAPNSEGAKVRQFPPSFGSASLVVSDPNPELEEIAKKLVEKSGFDGYFALEAKYCSDKKQLIVIEVNPRPSLWFSATTASNTDLLKYWVNSLITTNLEPKKIDITTPVIWKYLYKDWVAACIQKKDRKKINWSFPERATMTYSLWDLNDPLPFFYDLWVGLSKWFRRWQ